MKIEIGKRYRNVTTGVEVTVTKITQSTQNVRENGMTLERKMNIISYDRDYASPGGTTSSGEILEDGTIENLKPDYVFKRTYVNV